MNIWFNNGSLFSVAPHQPVKTVMGQGEEEDGDAGGACCGILLTICSYILIAITFPFSLCVCIKQVQVRGQAHTL